MADKKTMRARSGTRAGRTRQRRSAFERLARQRWWVPLLVGAAVVIASQLGDD